MKCRLLVYYASPKTGTLLSGKPDEEFGEIPDQHYSIGDQVFLPNEDGTRRMLEVVGRKWIDGAMMFVCRETRVWAYEPKAAGS